MEIVGAVLETTTEGPFSETRPIRICDLELAPPEPGEVLVRLEAAGVCHSDLSVVNGSIPKQLPMVLGHEAAGTVVEAGDGETDLVPGDRVVMTFMPRCGSCRECATNGRLPCRSGASANRACTLLGGGRRLGREGRQLYHHVGISAFADHAVVNRRSLVKVADDVPPFVAALLGCAVLTGGGAILNVGQPAGDESVMVVGLGGVGVAAVLTALAIDCAHVIAVDVSAEKRALARELGASVAVSPQEMAAKGLTADVVVEAAGSTRALETALEGAAFGGRVVVVGLPAASSTAALPHARLVMNGQTVIGSYLGSAVPERDIPRYIELWRSGQLPVERLVSRRIELAEVNEALDGLASGQQLRQIIDFR